MLERGRHPRERFDVVVLGVGGMGSATCHHLALRGKRVLGIERFDIPHSLGSSHGVTRIIRQAYYEHPSYVPLLRRSYALWRDLETGNGERLLHITGSVDAGAPGDDVFRGSYASCQEHDIPHEILTSAALSRRFPGYRLPADHLALYQPDGGFVLSEQAIVVHVLAAQAAGAQIHARERALNWDVSNGTVRVTTDHGLYEAGSLVIATGAWIGQHAPVLADLVVPERQVLAWLQPHDPARFAPDRFPVFNLQVPEGRYYGLPIFGVPGFKFGRYGHLGESVDPDTLDRDATAADEAPLRSFADAYFPAGAGPTMALRACMFTNTPDGHFIIDRHPDHPNVVLASPCSGHGYKFCPVIGEILSDLATTGGTAHDISLFRLDRFAQPPRDPA
jgi:sarcosine oxidase